MWVPLRTIAPKERRECRPVWLVVAGLVRAVSAFASREGRGGNLLIALLDLAAGAVILAWPDLGLATVAVIIGIVLIVRGVLFIVAGWQLRRLDRAPNRTRAAPRGVHQRADGPLTVVPLPIGVELEHRRCRNERR